METLKHILGFCGESHPNIFTIIFIAALIISAIKYTKDIILK
jgi:hypothetical protein